MDGPKVKVDLVSPARRRKAAVAFSQQTYDATFFMRLTETSKTFHLHVNLLHLIKCIFSLTITNNVTFLLSFNITSNSLSLNIKIDNVEKLGTFYIKY